MKYAILGRGVWAKSIMLCLSRLGREYVQINTERLQDGELWEEYEQRIARALHYYVDDVSIVWLCIPPCLEVYHYITIILKLRFNLIVEKPLHFTQSQLEILSALASQMQVRFFGNFQFNYLPRLAELAARCNDHSHIFSAVFHSSKKNRHGVPANRNLGVHMYSIYVNHFNCTIFGVVESSYECADCRYVSLRNGDDILGYDFTNERVDVLSHFIIDCENWVLGSGRYLMDINHVQKVLSMMSD